MWIGAGAAASPLAPRISAITLTNPNNRSKRAFLAHTTGTSNCRRSALHPPRVVLLPLENRNKHASFQINCTSSSTGDDIASGGPSPSGGPHPPPPEMESGEKPGSSSTLWQRWKLNSTEMSQKLAKLGLAAVLAYGIFDGITYTTFFILAFLGYEKSTGQNPAANLKALIGIVLLMWTGNNVTRPFRVAGAAALAPVVDSGLRKLQDMFKLSKLVYAFALVVGILATLCFSVVGLLILSRWGK